MSGVCLACGDVLSCDACHHEHAKKMARLAVLKELREWATNHDSVVAAELVIPYGDLLAKLDEMEKE
jgi:Zn-finger protein